MERKEIKNQVIKELEDLIEIIGRKTGVPKNIINKVIKAIQDEGNEITLNTRNYEIFKKLQGNRAVQEDRIKNIINSINEVGYIKSPIVVNEKMEVIDGQGRLEAAERLNLPIHYIIVPGIGIEECRAMNINQKSWGLTDYIKSYADMGEESFILIQKIIKEYEDSGFKLGLFFTALMKKNAAPTKLIQNGTLNITKEDYKKAVERLDFVYNIYCKMDRSILKGRNQELMQVLIYCYDYKEVDKTRLIKLITDKNKLNTLKGWANISQCFQSLEEFYNKGISKKVYFDSYYKKEKQV